MNTKSPLYCTISFQLVRVCVSEIAFCVHYRHCRTRFMHQLLSNMLKGNDILLIALPPSPTNMASPWMLYLSFRKLYLKLIVFVTVDSIGTVDRGADTATTADKRDVWAVNLPGGRLFVGESYMIHGWIITLHYLIRRIFCGCANWKTPRRHRLILAMILLSHVPVFRLVNLTLYCNVFYLLRISWC